MLRKKQAVGRRFLLLLFTLTRLISTFTSRATAQTTVKESLNIFGLQLHFTIDCVGQVVYRSIFWTCHTLFVNSDGSTHGKISGKPRWFCSRFESIPKANFSLKYLSGFCGKANIIMMMMGNKKDPNPRRKREWKNPVSKQRNSGAEMCVFR